MGCFSVLKVRLILKIAVLHESFHGFVNTIFSHHYDITRYVAMWLLYYITFWINVTGQPRVTRIPINNGWHELSSLNSPFAGLFCTWCVPPHRAFYEAVSLIIDNNLKTTLWNLKHLYWDILQNIFFVYQSAGLNVGRLRLEIVPDQGSGPRFAFMFLAVCGLFYVEFLK